MLFSNTARVQTPVHTTRVSLVLGVILDTVFTAREPHG